jgi:hypothetical protein
MKKILLITSLLLTMFSSFASEQVARTYIVNEDGTVTFLNKVAPQTDVAGRTYIVNEDGTVTFLDRVAPSEFDMELLEEARAQIEATLEHLGK